MINHRLPTAFAVLVVLASLGALARAADPHVIEKPALPNPGNVAEANAIPVQRTIYPGFGSDGAALIRSGIPAALFAVSTRYTHSAFEMLDERDLIGAFDLLRAFVTTTSIPLPLGPS